MSLDRPTFPTVRLRESYDAEQVELDWVTNEFADELPLSDAVFAQSWWLCE